MSTTKYCAKLEQIFCSKKKKNIYNAYSEYVIIAFLYTEPTNSQLIVYCYAAHKYFDTIVSSSGRS